MFSSIIVIDFESDKRVKLIFRREDGSSYYKIYGMSENAVNAMTCDTW